MDSTSLLHALAELTLNPYSIFVLVFGLVIFVFNFTFWLRTRRQHKELLNLAHSLQSSQPDLAHSMEFFNFAKFREDRFLNAVAKFSNILYKLTDRKHYDNVARNFIGFGIDTLPLLGIIGTLLAISLTAFASNPDAPIDFQVQFSLALGSTFIALLFTVLNKFIESLWLHHHEYMEDFRGLLAMYQINQQTSAQPGDDEE